MVKGFFCLLFLSVWMFRGLEGTPIIEGSIDPMKNSAYFPIEGTITITHKKDEKIDAKSFLMGNKPLEVSFVKDVKMSASSDTLVTIYRFQLPAQKKGLYVLPAISVKIGKQRFNSTTSSYTIHDSSEDFSSHSSSKSTHSAQIFRLDAKIQGPVVLYPGERTTLLYRISYNQNIDLSRSFLPMIHPPHFKKIGDVHIRDYQVKEATMQDLQQEVEASEIGTFSFGPSVIEGYSYQLKAGQKIYASKLLKAEAPALTLVVKPFPEIDRPSSFTGALGVIQIESHLISPNSVKVGDTLRLQFKVKGVSNLDELRFPELECQPGFSGFFQLSDTPPLAEIQDSVKLFEIEVRPLTALVQEIPSIEFSSFDPIAEEYFLQHTVPIPITVNRRVEEAVIASSNPSLLFPFPSKISWPSPNLSFQEFQPDQLKLNPSKSSFTSRQLLLPVLVIGFILLLLQLLLKERIKDFFKSKVSKSEKMFYRAMKARDVKLLEDAFWNRLWEKGEILEGHRQIESEEIKEFMIRLQAMQYGKNEQEFVKIRDRAWELFENL